MNAVQVYEGDGVDRRQATGKLDALFDNITGAAVEVEVAIHADRNNADLDMAAGLLHQVLDLVALTVVDPHECKRLLILASGHLDLAGRGRKTNAYLHHRKIVGRAVKAFNDWIEEMS